MSSTTGRSAIRLPTLILLALLIGGCGEDSASPTAARHHPHYGGADHHPDPAVSIQVSPLPEPPAGADQFGCGQTTQPAAEGVGHDDERMELALGVGGGLDRRSLHRRPVRAH
jgi:hypothetical protein